MITRSADFPVRQIGSNRRLRTHDVNGLLRTTCKARTLGKNCRGRTVKRTGGHRPLHRPPRSPARRTTALIPKNLHTIPDTESRLFLTSIAHANGQLVASHADKLHQRIGILLIIWSMHILYILSLFKNNALHPVPDTLTTHMMVNEYPPVIISDSRKLDITTIHAFVVKLSFRDGSSHGIGSGFFVKIPDSPYEVILTAGHNLYTQTKTFTTQLQVLLPNPYLSSSTPHVIPIPAERVKVSPEYVKDTANIEADYGVILIPYTGKADRRGFGFKMTHAFAELQGKVTVSGHSDKTTPGRPVMSTGVVAKESTENQLVYEIATEKGNSGSPVWLIDNTGEVAVVAVHNHKPETGFKGARGSRISPKLLHQVFVWAELDSKKKIRAQNISKALSSPLPSSGLYMIFEGKSFARVRRGTGTEFDVFPAQVSSTSTTIRYVLALDEEWVTFDSQQALLVDKPREESMFTKQLMRNPAKQPHIVYIRLGDNYLRLDGSKFKDYDLPDARASGVEISRVSAPFTTLTLEPYKPFTLLPTATEVNPQESTHCSLCGSELPRAPQAA